MVVFGQSGGLSSKSDCIRIKVIVLGQSGLFGQKWLCSGKVVVIL